MGTRSACLARQREALVRPSHKGFGPRGPTGEGVTNGKPGQKLGRQGPGKNPGTAPGG